jgi:hypothetical protein
MYVIVKYAGEPFVNKEMYVSVENMSSLIQSTNKHKKMFVWKKED